MTAAEHELLQLLTSLRATFVGIHRALRQVPGASKAQERILCDLFDSANGLEVEIDKLVKCEVVKL